MYRLLYITCFFVLFVIACDQNQEDIQLLPPNYLAPLDRNVGACCYHVDRCNDEYNNFRRFDYTFYRRADFPPPPQNIMYFVYLENWLINNCPGIASQVNWDSILNRMKTGKSIIFEYDQCLECRVDQAIYPGTACSN